MINEFEDVRIKETKITGTVVDISTVNGKTTYIVECDLPNVPNGYGPENRLLDCKLEELEKI